jgi:hypothetical protein
VWLLWWSVDELIFPVQVLAYKPNERTICPSAIFLSIFGTEPQYPFPFTPRNNLKVVLEKRRRLSHY